MNPKAEGPRPKASTSPNRLLFGVRFLRFFRVLEAPRASPQAGPRSPQAPRRAFAGHPGGREGCCHESHRGLPGPSISHQSHQGEPWDPGRGEIRGAEGLKGGRGGAVIPRSLVRTAPMFRECHGCPRHSLPCPRGRHLQSSSASVPLLGTASGSRDPLQAIPDWSRAHHVRPARERWPGRGATAVGDGTDLTDQPQSAVECPRLGGPRPEAAFSTST